MGVSCCVAEEAQTLKGVLRLAYEVYSWQIVGDDRCIIPFLLADSGTIHESQIRSTHTNKRASSTAKVLGRPICDFPPGGGGQNLSATDPPKGSHMACSVAIFHPKIS